MHSRATNEIIVPGRDEMPAVVRFFGHATTSIEIDGVLILTDPVLRARVAHLGRRGEIHPAALERRPDAVLISHAHQDHLDFPSLSMLGRETHLIVPAGVGRLLARRGFHNARERREGERAWLGGVSVLATPANHDGWRPPFGPRAGCLGFIVEGTERVYFAGDTDLFPEMASLGRVDLALLPVWGWGRTLGPGHLDPRRAAEALTLIRPTLAVPVHWGSFFPLPLLALGRGRRSFLDTPPLEFAAFAREIAPDVVVRVLQPGELYVPDSPRR
jgi:L-ascorbate metabolism protein UlaG (beta-lactamase superfamily)